MNGNQMKPSTFQFQGCLIGQYLGDALGFPVESKPPLASS